MKKLVKNCSLFVIMTLSITGCQKTEITPMSPVSQTSHSRLRSHSDAQDSNGAVMFTDKDKCKKCHTGKSMNISWKAPYMNDHRYSTIEELVANYDFANNVHLFSKDKTPTQTGVSEVQKQELIEYLKNFIGSSEAIK